MKTLREYINLLTETTTPGEWVYHASYLPNKAQGLKSVATQGLKPSAEGYAGPGVYFAYNPDDCYYHVDKKDATMFRAKWSDLVKLFGTYPQNPHGIERDDEQIIVPKTVPANILEVEYYEDEWWEIPDAYRAELGPQD